MCPRPRRDALAELGLHELPDDKADLKHAVDNHARVAWVGSAKASAVAMKPTFKPLVTCTPIPNRWFVYGPGSV